MCALRGDGGESIKTCFFFGLGCRQTLQTAQLNCGKNGDDDFVHKIERNPVWAGKGGGEAV